MQKNKFPSTRFQGSKVKIIDWLMSCLAEFKFDSCLDAFGGTSVVSYSLKQLGKEVTYNDKLVCNFNIGNALIANNSTKVTEADCRKVLERHNIHYHSVIQDNFSDIYYTDEENVWLDQVTSNIHAFFKGYKKSLLLASLYQAALSKRPYNLFHRKNLYMRLAKVERSFGNKATWEKPFPELFVKFIKEFNAAVFSNQRNNSVLNLDVLQIVGEYDLVYLDPPYMPEKGAGTDYEGYYHFLDGLSLYHEWSGMIDYTTKHRRLKKQPNAWSSRSTIGHALDELLQTFNKSIIAISYRSDGLPTRDAITSSLKNYKKNVIVYEYGKYKYALSKNNASKEVLYVGY